MPSLSELLEERKKKRDSAGVNGALDGINDKLNNSQMMMFVDKTFCEAIAKEVSGTNDLLEAAIKRIESGDEGIEETIDEAITAVKKDISSGLSDIGKQIKDKDVRGKVMELSDNITRLITVLESGNKKTQEILAKSLEPDNETAKQIAALAQAVQSQADMINEMITVMRTPRVLIMDDDGNPIGAKYEF